VVDCKVDRNTETVNLCFFGNTGGILEAREIFPRQFLPINPYVYRFMGRNWQIFALVHGILEYARILGFRHFGSVTVESMRGFTTLRFGATDLNLPLFKLYR